MQYYSSYQAYNKNIQMLFNNGIYHFQTDFGNGSCYNNKIYNKNIYYAGQQVPVLKKPPYFSLPGGGGEEEDDDTDEEEDDDDDDNLLVMNVINYNNEEEVAELQKELASSSNKIKGIAESQQGGIGLTDDFEPRDDDIVSDVSQDSNMSFQTDGDQMTDHNYVGHNSTSAQPGPSTTLAASRQRQKKRA